MAVMDDATMAYNNWTEFWDNSIINSGNKYNLIKYLIILNILFRYQL